MAMAKHQCIRVPPDVKRWLEQEAARNVSEFGNHPFDQNADGGGEARKPQSQRRLKEEVGPDARGDIHRRLPLSPE